MTREELFTLCANVLSEVLAIPRDDIRPDSDIIAELHGDSLDVADASFRLEEHLGVDLDLTKSGLAALRTVEDIVECLERKVTTTRQ
jgi:acyl carrier protein